MIDLLASGRRVLCVDESWISETEYSRRMWCTNNSNGTVTQKAVNPRLSVLSAIDTDGRIYFALSHALTDSFTMSLFMVDLLQKYDVDVPGWRTDTVVLLDNAAWHKNDFCYEVLQ